MERNTYRVNVLSTFAQNARPISLFNAVNSGLVLRIVDIGCDNVQINAVTGVVCEFNLQKTSAQSGGSAVDFIKYDSKNPALPSQVSAAVGATVTATDLLDDFTRATDEKVATSNSALGLKMGPVFPLHEFNADMQLYTLREGEGVSILQVTSTTVGTYFWHITFTAAKE